MATSNDANEGTSTDDIAMYTAVATRRAQWDNLLWQVPILSLTGQAFLFTIALGGESRPAARFIAAVLSIIMTALAIYLMARHRQAEQLDAGWLQTYEEQHFGRAQHGPGWAGERDKQELAFFGDRIKVRVPGRAFTVWSVGLGLFGVAAVAVLFITWLSPGLLAAPTTP